MKKTLLSIAAVLAANIMIAQVCIPNPAYENESFGIWPTAEEGFVDGQVDALYQQIIDFKIPSDPNDLPAEMTGGFPIPQGTTIDSIAVNNVEGLPEGLFWECNSHSGSLCTFHSQEQGCALIGGLPTEAGTFQLSLQLSIYVFSDFLGGVAEIPYEYTDYEITVHADPNSVHEMAQFGLTLNQNAPNPFSDQTVIEFSLNQPVEVDFSIYNLLGKVVHVKTMNATSGTNRIELNASSMNLTPGIYLYSLTIDGQSVTRKMVVK